VDLRDFKVGDFVRARVDLNRRMVLSIRKFPPPVEDDQYWDAVRQLEAETRRPVP